MTPGSWATSRSRTHEPRALYAELLDQAVTVPGPAVARLCEAAREARVHVAVGVNERNAEASGTSLYNARRVRPGPAGGRDSVTPPAGGRDTARRWHHCSPPWVPCGGHRRAGDGRRSTRPWVARAEPERATARRLTPPLRSPFVRSAYERRRDGRRRTTRVATVDTRASRTYPCANGTLPRLDPTHRDADARRARASLLGHAGVFLSSLPL